MIIFKDPAETKLFLSNKTNLGTANSFIPTMGALHAGHIALVEKARSEATFVVCSIFVNPSQFNDPNDFEKYPKTLEQDIYMLEKAGCDFLFLPSAQAMYPGGAQSKTHYDLGYLETILEGKYRPGHFQGVCQAVHRLLDIVRPAKLYIGQKDFQQCLVIRKLIELLDIKTQIIIAPTLREPDGLAMSSRNQRLSLEDRARAASIYKVLTVIKNNIGESNFSDLKSKAIAELSRLGFKVDYVEIAHRDTLNVVDEHDEKSNLVALAAAYLNNVRLIDNVLVN
jgi:pantoate--beta-alanine ligase